MESEEFLYLASLDAEYERVESLMDNASPTAMLRIAVCSMLLDASLDVRNGLSADFAIYTYNRLLRVTPMDVYEDMRGARLFSNLDYHQDGFGKLGLTLTIEDLRGKESVFANYPPEGIRSEKVDRLIARLRRVQMIGDHEQGPPARLPIPFHMEEREFAHLRNMGVITNSLIEIGAE